MGIIDGSTADTYTVYNNGLFSAAVFYDRPDSSGVDKLIIENGATVFIANADGGTITSDIDIVLKDNTNVELVAAGYDDLMIYADGHMAAFIKGGRSLGAGVDLNLKYDDGSSVTLLEDLTDLDSSDITSNFAHSIDWVVGAITGYFTASTTVSPIVLDLDASGTIELVAKNASGSVHWDIDGDGFREASGWITGGDGLLCVDLNSNGQIDGQSELFGNNATYANGYLALDAYADSNNSDTITSADANFGNLRVWVDANADGYSQSDELHTLSSLNITSISTGYTNQNYQIAGNDIKQSSTFVMNGNTYSSVDAWFAYDNANTEYGESYTLDTRVPFLPDLRGYGNLADLHIAMSMDNTGSGNLLDLVSDFAALPVGDLFAGNSDALAQVKDILFRWADVEGVDPDSRGDYIDAQHLAFVEKMMGQDYLQATNGNSPDPAILAAHKIDDIFQNALNSAWARMAAQAGGSTLFEGDWGYNPITDVVTGVTGLSQDVLDDLVDAADALTTLAEKTDLWLNVVRMIEYTIGLDSLDGGSTTALETALGDASLDLGNDIVPALLFNFVTDGDTIYGSGTVNGTDRGEAIHGTGSTNTINGGAGNDYIEGGTTDTIIGGTGNDYLRGLSGDDVYVYNLGDGNDTVQERYSGTDYIQFGAGIEIGDLTFTRIGNDYNIAIDTGSQTGNILLALHFAYEAGTNDDSNIEYLRFDDTTTYSVIDQVWNQTGTSGNDTLRGLLRGGSLNETFTAGAGIDTVYAGTEDDTVYGGDGADTLYGEDGNDTLYGDAGNDYIYGGDGADTIYANDSGDTGSDHAYGGDGNDTLYGNGDWLYGDGGNDTLNVGTGNGDAVAGGSGTDTVVYSIASTNMIVYRDHADYLTVKDTYNLSDPVEWIYNDVESIQFTDVTLDLTTMTFVLNGDGWGSAYPVSGTSGNDTINGYFSSDTIHGYNGHDTINGNGGNDTLYGDEGNDTIHGNGGNDTLYGGNGNNYLYGDDGDDALYGDGTGTDYIYGGNGNDTIYGSGDWIFGGDGTDTIMVSNGDAVDGGNGTDTAIYNVNSTNYIIYRDNASYLSVKYTANPSDYVEWIYNNVEAIQFNDVTLDLTAMTFTLNGAGWGTSATTYGTSGNDTITLYPSNDTVYAGSGNDTVNGGYGNDTIYGEDGTDTLNGNDGNDTIYGGNGNDTIHGNAGDDVIRGGDGNNYLYGDDGADTLYGDGTGTDYIYGGNGNDTIYGSGDYVFGGDGNDTIMVSNGDAVDGGNNTDVAVYNTASTDFIIFRNNSSYLSVKYTANPSDYVEWIYNNVETIQFNDVTLDLTAMTFTLNGTGWGYSDAVTGTSSGETLNGTQAHDEIYGAGGNDTINGGYGNDKLYGDAGTDTLNGGEGNDILFGGANNDTLSGGNGTDTANYSTAAAAVTASLSAGTASNDGDGGSDTFSGIENLIGSAYNDTLTGDGNANRIDGGAGTNSLTGGSGADIFAFDPAVTMNDIQDFSTAQGDKLDISSLIEAYDPLTHAITDWVQITESGGNSALFVDADGIGSTYGFNQVASLIGATGLTDEAALLAAGTLIAA